jgi:hypothetical protein
LSQVLLNTILLLFSEGGFFINPPLENLQTVSLRILDELSQPLDKLKTTLEGKYAM